MKDDTSSPTTSLAAGRSGKFLRAALFFVGSAAFGGLAVALWDRKILASLRGKEGELAPGLVAPGDEAD